MFSVQGSLIRDSNLPDELQTPQSRHQQNKCQGIDITFIPFEPSKCCAKNPCHPLPGNADGWRPRKRGALSLALALGWVLAIAQITGEAPLSQDNLLKEVGNSMQETQK